MRRISFGLTREQLLDGSKDVTRRLGWEYAKAGDVWLAVNRVMGFRNGERAVIYGTVKVRDARRERLDAITRADVRREGFPDKSPAWFVDFFSKAMRCSADRKITRIEFVFTPTEETPCPSKPG